MVYVSLFHGSLLQILDIVCTCAKTVDVRMDMKSVTFQYGIDTHECIRLSSFRSKSTVQQKELFVLVENAVADLIHAVTHQNHQCCSEYVPVLASVFVLCLMNMYVGVLMCSVCVFLP